MADYLSSLRKKAGWIKWQLTEAMWDRLRGRRAERLRPRLLAMAKELPAVSRPPGNGYAPFDVHMLCGHANADMGIWASWSFARFIPDVPFYIHSDGTLTEEDFRLWNSILPGAIVVERGEADDKVREALGASMRTVVDWRETCVVAAQNIDYHLYGTAPYVLSLDSDVLCFRNPVLVRQLAEAGTIDIAYMRDAAYAYSAPVMELEAFAGAEVPLYVNGGFFLGRRFGLADFSFMEESLITMPGPWTTHYWLQQTLVALWAAKGKHQELPKEYQMYRGRTRDDSIVRHYSGVVPLRPRFFTEGVPRLWGQVLKGNAHS